MKRSRFLHSLLYRFNNIPLRRKIVLSYFFFVFLLVGILAVSIYTFTSASIIRQNTFSLAQSFHQANSYLTYKLNGISSSSDMLIYNVTLNSILSKASSRYSSMNQMADSKTILSLLKNMEENEDIKRARIYVPDSISYSDNNVNICSFSQARSADWWGPLFEKKGIHLFVGNDMLEDTPYLNQNRIALIRAMYSQEDYSRLAFILRLDIPLSTIEEILNSANYTSDSVTLLLDKEDNMVAGSIHSDNSPVGGYEMEEIFSLHPKPDEVTAVTLGARKYMMLMAEIKGTGWNMLTLVPYGSFTLAVTSLVKILLAASLIIMALAYVVSKPIAYTITKRIDALCRYMQKSKDGELMEIPEVIYKDEIGILYENYNFMISRIRNLLSENYKMGTELKSAEFKALQSQINPHFLYNTLDMISWLSYQDKSEEISSVVYALARFYKISLNKGSYIVPISDEINHVTYYMEIQDLRFSGNVHFITDMPPELLQFSIPKITLQPIVENALFHGILEKKDKAGTIILSGSRDGEDLCLTIEDNGIGIPSKQLNLLLDPKAGGNPFQNSGSHYGLRNIDNRIKLQYGERYGLSFESIEDIGTKVHILLPAVHVDEITAM